MEEVQLCFSSPEDEKDIKKLEKEFNVIKKTIVPGGYLFYFTEKKGKNTKVN